MLREAVLHIPDSSYAYALDEQSAVFRLRVGKDDLKRCTLYYGDRVCEQKPIRMKSCRMEKAASDRLFDYYECELANCWPRLCYYFLLESVEQSLFYYADAFHPDAACDRSEYYQFPYIRREDVPRVPEWAADAVIYQIFPDSFADGCRQLQGTAAPQGFHGGTLRGIFDNMDYISGLGVNCLYLNPIFSSSSSHRYDTSDYFTVDPRLGTMQDLKELVKACHRNGIRVLLDGVFNHCGTEFFAFQDALKKGEESRYAEWFYQMEFPVRCQHPPNYAAFAYVPEMPKLNTGNPEVARYFLNVGRYWIREADIDGWRLDVANEINHDFWRQFRRVVKEEKPDSLLIGEIWEDAQPWLNGDQLDSTMNYRFSNLCRTFFADRKMDARSFGEELGAMLMRYRGRHAFAQMNLLDSHDVPRFLTRCGGDLQRWKLAFFFQMTFVGAPSLLYGDEAALTGRIEADYRQPMPWTRMEKDTDLRQYVCELIEMRSKHAALRRGDFKVCFTHGGVLAFTRCYGDEKLLIVLNNSDSPWKQDWPGILHDLPKVPLWPPQGRESLPAMQPGMWLLP